MAFVVAPRQKRWAPKVKTGCATCRIRRIKCDETKPACQRCSASGRTCSGFSFQRLVLSPSPIENTDGSVTDCDDGKGVLSAANNVSKQYQRPTLPSDVCPIGWDFVETCRYRDDVIFPIMLDSLLVLSDDLKPSPIVPARPSGKHVIIAHALAYHLAYFGGGGQGTIGNRVEAHIRSNLYYHAAQAIKAVNQDISDLNTRSCGWTFNSIMYIQLYDLMLPSKTWRAHIEGFLALLRTCGGIPLLTRSDFRIRVCTLYNVTYAVTTNTTSPPDDQIQGISHFSIPDLYNAYTSGTITGFPCPSHLFLDILAINMLRVQRPKSDDLLSSAIPIFDHIDAFFPDSWTEPYDIPAKSIRAMIASIFKSSVALYGALVLRQYVKPVIAAGHFPRPELLLSELLLLINEAAKTLRFTALLSWPLAVAGVAAADATAADQKVITSHLRKVKPSFNKLTGPMRTMEKLEKFWVSGKTAWDECFDEPCFVLAIL